MSHGWDMCFPGYNFNGILILMGQFHQGIELQMILKLLRFSSADNKGPIPQGIVLKALLKILAEAELKTLDCNCVHDQLKQGDNSKLKPAQ